MNTEWFDRIKSESGRARRFKIINSESGFGSWLEFKNMEKVAEGVVLRISTEAGEGWVRVSDTDGNIRSLFNDRNWCFGVIVRHGNPAMLRLKLIDEHSSGRELGIRVYMHWRHGEWKVFPLTDENGRLAKDIEGLSFGWSPNGNGYYWEPKPTETDTQEEPKKTPKTFVPRPAEMTLEPVPVAEKKPKVFVPKNTHAANTTVHGAEKKPKIFVPKPKTPDGTAS